MNPERWRQVRDLLTSVLELDPAERFTFLDRHCSSDPALRQELEKLLSVKDEVPSSFLETAALEEAALQVVSTSENSKIATGMRLGPYQAQELLGAGGMGQVYRAFRADDQYCKQVAVKVVRQSQNSRAVIGRFKNERQILADLDHPNIARLLDGGTTKDGDPFFVMEMIEGLPINDYCDRHRLGIRERLELFCQVCSAVEFAHRHLIVHRDIKPSNILVTSDGVAKLLDFGIAKILGAQAVGSRPETTLTVFRPLTPGYASPEQMTGAPITTASDVYSLGVVLYELLTGRSPYRRSNHTTSEIVRAVCETEPEKLSVAVGRNLAVTGESGSRSLDVDEISAARQTSSEKLSKRLAGDLDNIVAMALRKEPQRRYPSVEQFAQDIRWHLTSLPVKARKDTLRYRTSKFIARHKVGVAAAAVVMLTALLGMAAVVREARVASAERKRAEHRFNDLRNLSNSLLFDIHDSIRDLPGATAARKVLADRALQYLDSLAREAVGDPALQRELASAYERLGDVQGKPLDSSLGDDAGALQSYYKSLALRENVARMSQSNPDDAVSLARIHRLITNAAVETGDISGALEHAKKAVAAATAIADSKRRNSPAAESELAWDYMALGCVESGGGFNSAGLSDPLAAIRDFDQALAITSQLLNNDPDNESLAYENALLYERIGGLQGMHGRRPEGIQNLNIALNTLRSIGARTGNASRSFQRSASGTTSVIGEVQVMDGRFQLALATFQKQLAAYQNFAERDPQDLQAREDLSGAYYDVGNVLAKMRRFKDGLTMIRRAIALDKQLISTDLKRTILHSNLAQHRVAEAEALNKIGDPTGALESYKEARGFYQGLADLDDQNLDAHLNVSATDAKIAATYMRLGLFEDALETYRRALRVSEPPARSNPPNLQAQYTLADTYSGLGDVAVHLADRTSNPSEQLLYWTEASSWYEKSLAIWRMIPNRSVISPSEFDVGDPGKTAKQLAVCKATLDELKKSPAVRSH